MDDEITEMEMLDPDRVDAVKGPANGTPFLMLKAQQPDDDDDDDELEMCGDPDCEVCDPAAKAKLKAADRKRLPKSAFAIPEKAPGSGSYPIPDEAHARAALGRVETNGTPDEKKRVRAAVHRKFPGIELDDDAEKMSLPSQDQVQGRMTGADVAASSGQTQELAEDEAVHGDVQNDAGKPDMARYAAAARHQSGSALSQGGREGQGFGDTAPEKGVDVGASEAQTRAAKANSVGPAEASSTGDAAPDAQQDTAQAEREAGSQTASNHADEGQTQPGGDQLRRQAAQSQKGQKKQSMTNPDQGDADTPGTHAWEDKDVAIATEAVASLRHALDLAQQFQSRERTETKKKATKQISAAVQELLAVSQSNAAKEIENMTVDELIQALADRDRKVAKQAKKDTKKQAKKEAKRAEKAAKAAESGEASDEAVKSLQDRVAAMETAGQHRPALNGYAEARPILRGEPPKRDAFATLEKAIAEARTPQERTALQREFAKAKLVANNKIQVGTEEQDALRPHAPVALISQPPEAFVNARAAMGRR